MAWIDKYLSSEDFKKIEAAISRAEENTSGEIVPVIVRKSSAVGHVPLTLTLVITLILVIAEFPFSDWLWITPWVYLWPVLLVVIYGLSLLLAQIPWIQKVLVSEKDELEQVHQRAQLEFYANTIHRTENGTGILLFVSVMEKKAVVLGDEGISKQLPPEIWNELLQELGGQLNKGAWSEGFITAIDHCGDLLKTHFPISSPSQNQLKNHLVVKD